MLIIHKACVTPRVGLNFFNIKNKHMIIVFLKEQEKLRTQVIDWNWLI
jgi:hypothetical protein